MSDSAQFSTSRESILAGTFGRRRFLGAGGLGFLGSALGYLWARDGLLAAGRIEPPVEPRVRSVIFLFMCGGVSHMDTFDPKGNRWAGKMLDVIGSDNGRPQTRPVIHCPRTFTRYGESGIPVSEWFPHVGGVIDDIAVVRSMFCHQIGHFPAATEMATAHRDRLFEHPTLGAWISYALGAANENLPTFVNMGRPSTPTQLDGGFLGVSLSATPFQASGPPLENLALPPGLDRRARDRHMAFLAALNRRFHEEYAIEQEIAARTRSYELAARLQLSAPEAVDFATESARTLALYGVDEPKTNDFGRQLLLARRLVERGVRFVQICHGGYGNGRWDSHDDVNDHGPLCFQTDKPIAGLIQDLKQRGLLDSTLLVWATEFGRTPWSQNTVGRDHNPHGFSVWLAGGGVRGGTVHGATDEIGHRSVEDRHYVSDLQATILEQMGLDYTQMEVEVRGQPIRMIEEGEGPIRAILS
jgi:hypothetical protein